MNTLHFSIQSIFLFFSIHHDRGGGRAKGGKESDGGWGGEEHQHQQPTKYKGSIGLFCRRSVVHIVSSFPSLSVVAIECLLQLQMLFRSSLTIAFPFILFELSYYMYLSMRREQRKTLTKNPIHLLYEEQTHTEMNFCSNIFPRWWALSTAHTQTETHSFNGWESLVEWRNQCGPIEWRTWNWKFEWKSHSISFGGSLLKMINFCFGFFRKMPFCSFTRLNINFDLGIFGCCRFGWFISMRTRTTYD